MDTDKFIWDSYEDGVLTDYVFASNLSAREMAKELGTSETEVRKRIRELGLSWVRRRDGHASRGQAALTATMRKLLRGQKVVTEHPIGERLRLDVYCPSYKLAAEYHGRQHFYYVEHFHGDMDGFIESKQRDQRKMELCQEADIALVVFRYNDLLDEDTVFQRLLEAMRSVPKDEPEKVKIAKVVDPYHEAYLQRQREMRKEAYRRMKSARSRGRRG